MVYQVLFRPGIERDLKRVPAQAREKILSEIASLGEDPRPAGFAKLKGSGNFCRLRVGDYRVIYTVEDAFLVVLVIEIGHRKEIYRKPDKKLTRHFLREFIKKEMQ